MKAIIILLLVSLSLCEIEYAELKVAEKTTNLNENKLNGEFTACIACLQDEECKKMFYEEILYDLTDEYDKEDLTLESCQSLSGNPDFDNVINQHLQLEQPPLLNKKSLKLKEAPPNFELKDNEYAIAELNDDIILRSLKSWIRDRIKAAAKKLIDKIRDALHKLVDMFCDWLEDQANRALP